MSTAQFKLHFGDATSGPNAGQISGERSGDAVSDEVAAKTHHILTLETLKKYDWVWNGILSRFMITIAPTVKLACLQSLTEEQRIFLDDLSREPQIVGQPRKQQLQNTFEKLYGGVKVPLQEYFWQIHTLGKCPLIKQDLLIPLQGAIDDVMTQTRKENEAFKASCARAGDN